MTGQNGTMQIYGEREDIREMKDRLELLLPSVKNCGPAGAMALAQVAISMDLNPFLGEVWLIPQKKGGQVVGFSVMAGIKGIRRAARRQAKGEGGYYTPPRFRLPTSDEMAGVITNKGDIVVACDIEIWTAATVRIFKVSGHPVVVSGVGIYRAGESTKMEPLQAARKRAEADALKMAFDLPFGAGDPVLGPEVEEGDWRIDRTPEPESRQTVEESREDLYGTLPDPDRETEAAFEETEAEFVDLILVGIPFYGNAERVRGAMRELELEFSTDVEARASLIAALDNHAQRLANERAAAEAPVTVQQKIAF